MIIFIVNIAIINTLVLSFKNIKQNLFYSGNLNIQLINQNVGNSPVHVECDGELNEGSSTFTAFTSPNYPEVDNTSRICNLNINAPSAYCGVK